MWQMFKTVEIAIIETVVEREIERKGKGEVEKSDVTQKVVCVGERTKVGNVIFLCGSVKKGELEDLGHVYTHVKMSVTICVC